MKPRRGARPGYYPPRPRKLMPEQEQQIRSAHAAGATVAELARIYECTGDTIRRIVRRDDSVKLSDFILPVTQ